MDKIFKKIKQINNKNVCLIAISGIMGGSKSTTAGQLKNILSNCEIVSTDALREKFARQVPGNENKYETQMTDVLFNFENKVWGTAFGCTRNYLKNGISVIFDATLLTPKQRKNVIQIGKEENVKIISLYIDCPLDLALERNLIRSTTVIATDVNGESVYGRYVPSHVIEDKYRTQILSQYNEGFDHIFIHHIGLKELDEADQYFARHIIDGFKTSANLLQDIKFIKEGGHLDKVLPSLVGCWGFDQQNKHHHLLLHEHMIECARHLQNESLELFVAGLLHDIGKFHTKQKFGKLKVADEDFKEKEKVIVTDAHTPKFITITKLSYKGDRISKLWLKTDIEVDENCHYYNHEFIGALLARREVKELGFDEEFANKVYNYILNHMNFPYNELSEKQANELIKKYSKDELIAMMKFKFADKSASINDEYINNIYPKNKELIETLLG